MTYYSEIFKKLIYPSCTNLEIYVKQKTLDAKKHMLYEQRTKLIYVVRNHSAREIAGN